MPEDIVAALEWQAEQDATCPGCGGNIYETFGPANEDTWNADLIGHCDGCRARHRTEAALVGRDELDPTVGSRFRLRRDEPNGSSSPRSTGM